MAKVKKVIKKLPDISEYQHQVMIFEWAQMALAEYPELDFMVGSMIGFRMNIGTAMKAKRSGCLKKNWPDIFLAVPKGPYHGLFIELKPLTRGKKNPKREGASKGQRYYLKKLAGMRVEWEPGKFSKGYYAAECFGADAAIQCITDYLEERFEI